LYRKYKGRKLSFKKSRLKILFEMEITIFNQGVVLEDVNLATKVMPPLKEPNWTRPAGSPRIYRKDWCLGRKCRGVEEKEYIYKGCYLKSFLFDLKKKSLVLLSNFKKVSPIFFQSYAPPVLFFFENKIII